LSKPEQLWVQTFVVKIVSEKRVKPIELCGVEHLMFGGDDGKSCGGWYKLEDERVPFEVAKRVVKDLGEDPDDLVLFNPLGEYELAEDE